MVEAPGGRVCGAEVENVRVTESEPSRVIDMESTSKSYFESSTENAMYIGGERLTQGSSFRTRTSTKDPS